MPNGGDLPTANPPGGGNRSNSNIPIPDPSLLTTAALEREIGHLRELFLGQIQSVEGDLDAYKVTHEKRHLDFMETALGHMNDLLGGKIDNLQQDFDRYKEYHGARHADAVDTAIKSLKDLMLEKFVGVQDKMEAVQRQFDERDERTRLAFEAAEKAVAAALLEREKAVQAALEASDKAGTKTETTFTKLIEGLQAQIGTQISSILTQINDIKVRLASGEGAKVATVEGREKFSQNWAMIIGAILAVIGFVSVAVAVFTAVSGP